MFPIREPTETTKLTTENDESLGMNPFGYEDKLELIGLLAGGFVIIVALGTLLEPPWTTNEQTGAAIVQSIGVVLSVLVGIAMIHFTHSGGLRALLPGGE